MGEAYQSSNEGERPVLSAPKEHRRFRLLVSFSAIHATSTMGGMTTHDELSSRLKELKEQIEELESTMPDDRLAAATVELDVERAKFVQAMLTKIGEGTSGAMAERLLAVSMARIASAVCQLRQDFEEYKDKTAKKQKRRS